MDGIRDWIREGWRLAAAGGTALLLAVWWWQGRPIPQPPGVLAPEDPVQTAADSQDPWTFRNHLITPLARFEIRARVLGKEHYRFDRPSELSPVDLALGWGCMSDSRILDTFSIRQGSRWYFWSAPRMPVSPSDVVAHSANMHMIPATRAVEARLRSVKPGQVVALRGQLVRADGPDGWHWVSSLSRTDTGDGSCEVVWLESLRTADR